MRALKSPGALAAAGALKIDQLGGSVVSLPIASLHQLQAPRIVSARTPHCRFHAHSLNGTRIIVVSTCRPFLDVQRLSDLRPSNWVPDATHCDPNVSSKFAAAN
jgi:hypothetical protein